MRNMTPECLGYSNSSKPALFRYRSALIAVAFMHSRAGAVAGCRETRPGEFFATAASLRAGMSSGERDGNVVSCHITNHPVLSQSLHHFAGSGKPGCAASFLELPKLGALSNVGHPRANVQSAADRAGWKRAVINPMLRG